MSSASTTSPKDGCKPQKDCVTAAGQHQTEEGDLDGLSNDDEEVQEEVAEAVQSARKERLRDDLLGMVCPVDWTIQAAEPPGLNCVSCTA